MDVVVYSVWALRPVVSTRKNGEKNGVDLLNTKRASCVKKPFLHLNDIYYCQGERIGNGKNRSWSAQVITLLYRALQDEEHRSQREVVLQVICDRRLIPPKDLKSSTVLLLEDLSR